MLIPRTSLQGSKPTSQGFLKTSGSISTWEDLTTRFLAQFFPSRRTVKLRNDILMFQQNQGESLSEALSKDLALYDNESWNDPRDFAKSVKAISLPQDVPSTFDRRLIERLMEAHLAPKQPIQVKKITSSCEICSGPHDTQYCMENPKQAFVDYAFSRTDEAGGKWYTFKPEQNNLGDTYNPSWKIHPILRWRQLQNSQNNFSNPPNRFQPKGLVSNFMASQDARLSKFEPDFKQQQSEMTNKIDTVLKAITDRMTGMLPSDTVKNPKLNVNSTSLVSTRREGQPEKHRYQPSLPPDPSVSFITEKVCKLNSFFKSLDLVPQSSDTEFVCTKGDDSDVMFIEIINKNDDSHKEEPKVGENAGVGESEVEYFDIFLIGNFTPGVVVFVFDSQVIFDEKKLGSS
ncbi:MAK10-like protein [Tanacetum coccineum]